MSPRGFGGSWRCRLGDPEVGGGDLGGFAGARCVCIMYTTQKCRGERGKWVPVARKKRGRKAGTRTVGVFPSPLHFFGFRFCERVACSGCWGRIGSCSQGAYMRYLEWCKLVSPLGATGFISGLFSLLVTYVLVSQDLNDEFYFDYATPSHSLGYQWGDILYFWLVLSLLFFPILFLLCKIFRLTDR